MIKRGPPGRYPIRYLNYPLRTPNTRTTNSFPVNPSNPQPNNTDKKNSFNKTKILALFSVIAIIVIIVVLILISFKDKPDLQDALVNYNADLKISNVVLLNESDVAVEIQESEEQEYLESIIFVFYDKEQEIARKKILFEELKEKDFNLSFHLANTSRISEVLVIPVFVDVNGKNVEGGGEDKFVIQEIEERVDLLENISEKESFDCQEDLQCDDNNICTVNKCESGRCIYLATPGCIPCYDAFQCEDYNPNTENICFQGRCVFNLKENPNNITSNKTNETSVVVNNSVECSLASECNDNIGCTRDACANGKCVYFPIERCIHNDGCCPSGSSCVSINDNDCSPVCGNNILENNERCDENQLNSATCASIRGEGYTGILKCSNCDYNTSLCVPPCTQTCESLGYECGTQKVCGKNVVCGDYQGNCQIGYTCQTSNGTCMRNCVPITCTLLGRNCGTIGDGCGNTLTCGNYNGGCPTGYTCSSGVCVNSVTTNPPTNPPGIEQADYYVSPSGSDSNPGTIDRPFASINKAWSLASAGDLIYVRGGTYTYAKMGQTELGNKNGAPGSMIRVWNYPGEKPVIDFSDYSNTAGRNGIRISNSDYVHLKGIRVTNMPQPTSGAFTHIGFYVVKGSSNNIIENCEADNIGGWGFVLSGGSSVVGEACNNNLFLNCDSHHNSDRYSSDSYGGSDGFLSNCYLGTADISMNNTFRGCRAWWNSDDGWDLRTMDGSIIIDNCWAFWNGYIPGTFTHGGNGEGFKLGTKKESPNVATVMRRVTNSLAVENYLLGFHHVHTSGYYDFSAVVYNNFAYGNGDGGEFNFGTLTTASDTLRNNLAHGRSFVSSGVNNYNSWNGGVTVTDADFISLDASQLDNPRKSDGSLPDITFGNLVSGSDLINKGVNVGLPYSGTAPDLGAFEYSSPVPTIPAENIRYVSKTGVDSSSRDGSIGQEWASLSYACSRVKTAGYTIHVNPGNYVDNNKCDLGVGVSIEGDRNSPPNITTSYTYGVSKIYGYIELNSPAGNAVNGNQSISYINFNGNSKVSYRAIAVNYRSNVEVHHCNFSYFRLSGVTFHGTTSSWDVAPQNILPTGNQVHDCFFKSCANLHRTETNLWEAGHIRPEGQSGMRIYNNVFYQKDQAEGYNADIIAGYQNDGLKLYNNVFYKNDIEGDEWNFFYEMHYHRGGIEIYNNTFYGASTIDFSGTIKGKYDFGGKIYNNSFIANSIPPTNSRHQGYIDVETFTYVNDLYIYNNYFKNARTGIHINNAQISMNNIWVYNNIIEGVGNSNNSYSNGIVVEANWGDNTPTPIDNVYIYNNVITAAKNTYSGIYVSAGGDISNLNIKNNIIKGSFSSPIRINDRDLNTEINGLNINNNLFHGTSSSSISYSSDLIYNNRNDNGNLVNIDPLFVGGSPYNFRLTSSSPARSKGVYVGLDRDYSGQSWNNPPSIGAYEYK